MKVRLHGHWASREGWINWFKEQAKDLTDEEVSKFVSDLIDLGYLRLTYITIAGRRYYYPEDIIRKKGLRICESIHFPLKRIMACYMYYKIKSPEEIENEKKLFETLGALPKTLDPFAMLAVFTYTFLPVKRLGTEYVELTGIERYRYLIDLLDYLEMTQFPSIYPALEAGKVRRFGPHIEDKEVDVADMRFPLAIPPENFVREGIYPSIEVFTDFLRERFWRLGRAEYDRIYGYLLVYKKRGRQVYEYLYIYDEVSETFELYLMSR